MNPQQAPGALPEGISRDIAARADGPRSLSAPAPLRRAHADRLGAVSEHPRDPGPS